MHVKKDIFNFACDSVTVLPSKVNFSLFYVIRFYRIDEYMGIIKYFRCTFPDEFIIDLFFFLCQIITRIVYWWCSRWKIFIYKRLSSFNNFFNFHQCFCSVWILIHSLFYSIFVNFLCSPLWSWCFHFSLSFFFDWLKWHP